LEDIWGDGPKKPTYIICAPAYVVIERERRAERERRR
jgi:hypothetical protein